MISQTNSAALRATYTSDFGEAKSSKSVKPTVVTKQGDTSRVEQIKEAFNSGQYKVDLDSLSELIADELL
jgi:anti-sigma28 factor (negative regulator of flagellin synthesis)